MTGQAGVSFVVPVHNGEPWIRKTVRAILAQARADRSAQGECAEPFEVLLVDDCSTDGSSAILAKLATHPCVRIVPGPGRGAAAAINAGVRASRFPIIAQVDQDVVLQDGWMQRLVADLADAGIGAAQGYYVHAPGAALFARAMNLDLEQRYSAIDGRETDHVCTGNSVYRADALQRIGLFDESLGYGYDNDVSYRLRAAGFRLTINRDARSTHQWREGLGPYLVQQYGFGYGRIDLVAKHPHRVTGDAVSPLAMMLHPIVMLVAIVCAAMGLALSLLGGAAAAWLLAAAILIAVLAFERLTVGIVAARRFGDATALVFPVLHLARDLAWVGAIVIWTARRVARRPLRPSHSMTPRAAYGVSRRASAPAPKRPSA